MFPCKPSRLLRASSAALALQLTLLGAGLASGAHAATRRAPRAAAKAGQQTPPQPSPSPQAPATGAAAPAASPAAPAQTPAGPGAPPPQAEKPFAEIIKDAEVIKGLFTIYRKDEKVMMEIMPEQFDKIFLISPTMESGIGERGFLSAQVMQEFAFSLRRNGKNVQLVAKNVNYRAGDKAAIRRAVDRSFADSVISSAKFESQPHPDRKSVLVDLSSFLLTDLPLIGYALESVYRIPYRLDAKNSAFAGVKGFPDNVEIETLLNYSVERPPLAPLTPSPVPMPRPPLAPPDLRGIQFRVRYSLSSIPQTAYRPRLADDRVGHFATIYQDYTDDREDTPYVRYINRWNLVKKDPSAALSEPVQPVVFWMENAIPEKYRKAVADGVLMWNRAFERIGFKDAVQVKQQPDNSDWDPADVRFSTIRWFIATDAGFAIGPSRANPFTGEIYDADISFSEAMTRGVRSEFQEFVDPLANETQTNAMEVLHSLRGRFGTCNYANEAAREASFGYQMLLTRGLVSKEEAEEQYVRDFLTHVTAHEVGHTLGLRHNFRASTLHPLDKLQDTALTNAEGLTGSVMDYTPVNIAPNGAKQGQYWQTTLGTYDYWAIEYAYKPIAASSPEAERAELNKIASRVADAKLAYGTDEDVFGNDPIGIDPRTNRWDFASDPLPWYETRTKLVHELWGNLESKLEQPGKRYQKLRFAFNGAFGELALAMMSASKYVGGIYHNRDHIGDPGNRSPYVPVPAKDQRRALELLKTNAFGPDAFKFSPRLLNKLAIDRDWTFEGDVWRVQRLDYPVHQRVLALHRGLLDRLFHPILLSRLQDLEVKYENRRDAFTMSELFQGLQDSIWSELKAPGGAVEVNSFRRNLQREHLKRLQRLVLRQDPVTPEDASTLARYNLTQMRAQIKQALLVGGKRMNTMTRAHLQETAARIDETLNAQQQRVVN